MIDNASIKFKTEGLSTTGEILLGSNQVQEVIQALINEFDLKIKDIKKERDKYKSYFDSTLEKDYPANKYPRTKKPNKGM